MKNKHNFKLKIKDYIYNIYKVYNKKQMKN